MITRLFICFSFVLASFSLRVQSAPQPNIIFFFVDDLGYGDLGSFWQDGRSASKKFDTPGLDRMAADGVKLTHHYIAAPVCAPTRASLMQGMHQGHAAVRDNQFDNPLPDNHTIASVLQAAGYRTVHIGKNGIAGSEDSTNLSGQGSQNLNAHPLHRGWDRFFGYLFHGDGHEHYPRNGTTNKKAHIYDDYQQIKNASVDLYTTDAWTAFAKKEILEEVNDGDDQPFFIFIAYDTPHFNMQRPAVAYPGEDLQNGNHSFGLNGGIQWTTDTDSAGNVRYANTADGTASVDGYTHPDIGSGWSEAEKRHVGMIRRIDNSVADILQLLVDLGIDEDTICVFSSDNGPHHEGNDPRSFESFANMEGTKRDMWEAGIRVPTIVHWPEHLPAATGDESNIAEIATPTAVWDWMATFADLAGEPSPASIDGISLWPLLGGTGTLRNREALYFEYYHNSNTQNYGQFPNHKGAIRGQMQAVRIGDFMGVRTGITSAQDDFEIYNVVTDPAQGSNLAATRTDLQDAMQRIAITARRPRNGVPRPYDQTKLPDVVVSSKVNGLQYTSYEGDWDWIPAFEDLTPVSSGNTSTPDPELGSRSNQYGLLFTGYIEVPAAGAWTFHSTSDAGMVLRIHESLVIDDDYGHNGTTVSSDPVYLEAGLHPVTIYYRNETATPELTLEWESTGTPRAEIPAAAYYRAGTAAPGPPTAVPDEAETLGSNSQTGTPVDIPVLNNDLDDGTPSTLSILSIGTAHKGTAVQIGNSIRYTPNQGFFGKDRFIYRITDGESSSEAEVSVTVRPETQVYWFPLDETSGTQLTSADGSKTATLINPSASTWVPGKISNALNFNGSGFIRVENFQGITGAGDRTVCGWVKTAETGQLAFFGWGSNTDGNKWSVLVQEGNLRVEVTGGYKQGKTQINNGEWQHVAVTFANDGSANVLDAKLYINGVLETEFTNTSSQNLNTSTFDAARIGSDVQNRHFIGQMDDVRIYPRALTAEEISTLVSRDELGNDQSKWLWLNFGELDQNNPDWDANTDGDAFNLFGEYALGGSPHFQDLNIGLQLSNGPAGTLVNFDRRTSLRPYYLLSTRSSLVDGDWTPYTAPPTFTGPETEGYEKVEYNLGDTDAQFVRLRVGQTTP